ncbi:hypothetical protein [Methanobrevibacter sp.]|uniref:hypothetical protein n=1 Tax=Methanobrevibacter sp. TaxID=66852 RepID=UPI00386AA500
MTKHTVGTLIRLLEGFPHDLEIANELAVYWFYPNELKEYQERMSIEDYERLTQSEAYAVCVFEGSWENDSVVDHEDKMTELLEKYG